jgi:hypothetical protein
VTEEGVGVVMEIFARSRLPAADQSAVPIRSPDPAKSASPALEVRAALEAECDELFLDPSMRRR